MGYHGKSLGSNRHLGFSRFIHIYFKKHRFISGKTDKPIKNFKKGSNKKQCYFTPFSLHKVKNILETDFF